MFFIEENKLYDYNEWYKLDFELRLRNVKDYQKHNGFWNACFNCFFYAYVINGYKVDDNGLHDDPDGKVIKFHLHNFYKSGFNPSTRHDMSPALAKNISLSFQAVEIYYCLNKPDQFFYINCNCNNDTEIIDLLNKYTKEMIRADDMEILCNCFQDLDAFELECRADECP